MTEQVFVARERELAQLNTFLDRALAGHGQVCFVTGEAGAGKTALVTEFARRAQVQHADLLVAIGECNDQTGIGDPYLPFREVLGLLTGDVESRLAQGAITQENAGRLRAFLRVSGQALVDLGPDLIDILVPGVGVATRAGAFLAGRVGWLDRLEELTERKAATASSPGADQTRIFEQYTQVIQGMAVQQPLILVLDDLHWADASSIGLLFHLVRSIQKSRVLVIGTYRPEDVALGRPSIDQRRAERHPLESVVNELKRYYGDIQIEVGQREGSNGRTFVDALLDAEPNRLDEAFREALYRHTRGHSLFTVELLRDMQERGDLLQDEAGRWVGRPALDWDALPARVEGVIAERIGRLETELRETLTVASVEGEDFIAEVIARAQALDERGVVRRLSGELEKQHRLVGARGTHRLGRQRLSFYEFQHNLFQKYLYNSLDEVERAYLHEDIGNVLEELYGDQTEEVSVQLARHFQEAGIAEKAVHYLYQAGNRALRLSAYQEAIAHFTQGLALLETLPQTPERSQQELLLQTMLGLALIATRGYAAPEVEQAYMRARGLCQQLGETPQLFPVLWGLWAFYEVRSQYATAREIGEQLVHLAEQAGDPVLLTGAHFALGNTLFLLGELPAAQVHFEQVAEVYDPAQHRALATLYGQDPGVTARSWSAAALWLLGHPDQAVERSQEAVALAQELDHPFSQGYALYCASWVYQMLRDAEASRARAEASIAISSQHGFPFWVAYSTIQHGWALAALGEVEDGIAELDQAMAAGQAMGAGIGRPYFVAMLAEARGMAGQVEDALTLVAEALAVMEESGERWAEAEIYRLKGELLLAQSANNQAEAEACYRQAIDVARRQGTKSLELRAAADLARLQQAQGRPEEGCRMLEEVYGWFTEGFETAGLQEARALLRG
ncbi:MAG: AAA family ATPase [Anaerolineae bacterium]